MLHQFGRTFGEHVRLRDYLGVVLGAAVPAGCRWRLWALLRHLRDAPIG